MDTQRVDTQASPTTIPRSHRARTRLIVMVVAGLATMLIAGFLGWWEYAPTLGWAVAAAIFSAWVWIVISGFDATQTAEHAVSEEPGRATSDSLVVALSVASLVAVGFVLVHASAASGELRGWLAALALVSVALSWILLHTLYTLRYARLYYRTNSGIEFNQDDPPRYTDFAYLAFTLGMTYQVSDTNLTNHTLRSAALGHSLLSFLFGSFIVATTINLVVTLSIAP